MKKSISQREGSTVNTVYFHFFVVLYVDWLIEEKSPSQ